MKNILEISEKSINKSCKYSENPAVLRSLIHKLCITAGEMVVIPSPWNEDKSRQLNALHMLVTINGYTFSYYGSHVDAETMKPRVFFDKKNAIRRNDFRESLLYNILCCMRLDYSVYNSEPEDSGFNTDSIKDMAKWNEIKEHSRTLRGALRLTDEELGSLPD